MSLLDKVTSGAEHAAGATRSGAEYAADKVTAGAGQAATRARKEVEELKTKRELDQTYSELGRKALELADRGELSHAELAVLVERAQALSTGTARCLLPYVAVLSNLGLTGGLLCRP